MAAKLPLTPMDSSAEQISAPAKRPIRKGAKTAAAKKTATKKVAAKKAAAQKTPTKKLPTKKFSSKKVPAKKAAASTSVKRTRGPSGPRRSAVDRLDDPPPASGLALIARVSRAIERELSQIESIVGGQRVPPMQRSEAERRARTLASLARTLNEVKRLRDGEDKTKAGDDDALPRDLDDLRRELSRRLAQLDATPTDGPAGEHERGGA